MNGILRTLGFLAFVLFGAAQLFAGFVGIDHYFGAFWAGLALVLAFFLRFTLPITIGAFFGAMEVWGWHWFLAAVFAAPGLALVVPGALVGIFSWARGSLSRERPTQQAWDGDAASALPEPTPAEVSPLEVQRPKVQVSRRGIGWIAGAVGGFVVGLIVGVLLPRDSWEPNARYETRPTLGDTGIVGSPRRQFEDPVQPLLGTPESSSPPALDADQETAELLAQMRRIELGQLIRGFLLDHDKAPSWAILSGPDDPVRWLTDGVEPTRDQTATIREGIARVSVDGSIVTTLRRVEQELPWDITLASSAPPKFGPEYVTIAPRNDCFGSLGSGCEFSIEETVAAANLEIERFCADVNQGLAIEVFEVRAPNKQDALLVYAGSGGSGGYSNWITLYWSPSATDAEVRACLQSGG